jgi:F0F1-type ATP synthase membrane subunit b/b'
MTGGMTFYESLALWSEVLGAVAFLVVLVVGFMKYLTPAVAAATAARNAGLRDAEARRDKAKADVAAARAELETAEQDAISIRARGVEDASREREKIVAEATSSGEHAVHSAEGELDRARMAGSDALRADIVARALEIAREQAPKRVSAGMQSGLMADVVDRLESEKT